MVRSKELERLSMLKIRKIALGVRFDPQFSLMDSVGDVVDAILQSEATPFGPKVFPLSKSGPVEHILYNQETGDSLRITHMDLILEMAAETRSTNEVADLANSFEGHALNTLRRAVRIRGINRYGLLLEMSEQATSFQTTPIQHYLLGDFETARTMSLRFVRRLPTDEGMIKKGVKDFRQAIYTVNQDHEEPVRLAIDYQEYFDPSLDSADAAKKPYHEFVSRALAYYEGEFAAWLGRFRMAREVAS